MELNREQIIKALECCTNVGKCGLIDCKCDDCPYNIGEDDCKNLDEYALALIKKLTEENANLHASCTELERKCTTLSDIVENYRVELGETRVILAEANEEKRELAEENERLHVALNTDISIVRMSRGSGKTSHLREVGRIRVDAIKAYAVREMAERLEELYTDEVITDDMTVSIGVIKQNIKDIAKEMLEETK
jgi:phage shock protein A